MGSGESPFCPHCGTPQLFLALENQSAQTSGVPGAASSTGTPAPPRPQLVEWKTAIRCAAAVGAVGAMLTLVAMRVDALSLLSFLWIMSASLITMGFYQKRKPAAWIDVRVGARIGVVVGLCLAFELGATVAGAGLVARFLLHSMSSFDAGLAAVIAEGQRRSQQFLSAPLPPEVLAFERSPEFHAGYVLFYFAAGAAGLLLLSTVGGAFAGLLRMRRRPVA